MAAESRRIALLGAVVSLVIVVTGASAASRYDPALRFRTIVTPHFAVHYHQREHETARRLGRLAEEVHAELTTRMNYRPRSRTHVILVDQHDFPGGWATPVPYNVIEISATGPGAASLIGHTTDWIRLVFTHEYAHVLQLEQSRGWARAAGALFGRVPFAMPNLSQPIWQIEGLATYEESQHGEGRLHARDFDAIVREAARTGRFEPIDRVSGGLVDWPGGQAAYAYGARFHAHLAERYGDERVHALSRRTAGRIPYFTAGAYEHVFGRSLGQLWEEFKAAESALADAAPGTMPVTRLTRRGHVVSGPRFDRDGSIVYSRSDPHDWPALERLRPGSESVRLATRVGGEGVGITPDALYFDALDVQRGVALVADLYRLDRGSGRVDRLTTGARLTDADVSPDGTRIVAVRLDGGRRDLIVLSGSDWTTRRLLTAEDPNPQFSRPRWSPDGLRLAAESRIAGVSNIVILDVESGGRTLVAPGPGRNITPAWTPDGRALLFSSDRDGRSFALYRVRLAGSNVPHGDVERLTDLPGGAHSPDVSADGTTVVFVGYTADGYDLFTCELARGAEIQGNATRDGIAHPSPRDARDVPAMRVNEETVADGALYRPWSTLWPRAWLPVIEADDHQWQIGAATGGTDVLGYHAWGVTASWPVARHAEFDALSGARRANILASYVYDRWQPALYLQFEDDTTPLLAGRGTASEQPFSLRDRSATAGVVLPLRRIRWTQTLTAAWRLEHRTVETDTAMTDQTRGALRLGWGLMTARRFGYSVSPERGISAGASVEIARRALGSDFAAAFARGDIRAFLPAAPRHGVLALRVSGAAATGEREARRRVRLGGAGSDGSVLNLSEDASSLLRGFPADAFQGDRVALVNAEYRLPLGWPQRGVRSWPMFLRSIHATFFADAGHAWESGAFRTGDAKLSWGGELSSDVIAGFWLPITATIGVGWGRDGAGGLEDQRQVYVRLGHGF